MKDKKCSIILWENGIYMAGDLDVTDSINMIKEQAEKKFDDTLKEAEDTFGKVNNGVYAITSFIREELKNLFWWEVEDEKE